MPFTLPPLYPILDTSFFPPDPSARAAYLQETVSALASAGVTLLQLRAKQATPHQLLVDAHAIRAAAPASMRLILNDRVDLFPASGFDGVHLGQSDMPLARARALLGPHALLGLSTHTPAQARHAATSTADYLACGPIYQTSSKAHAEPAVGLEGLRATRGATSKPLVAIGGITLQNAASIWAAGADSLAVIGALFGPNKPPRSTPATIAEDFLKLFR